MRRGPVGGETAVLLPPGVYRDPASTAATPHAFNSSTTLRSFAQTRDQSATVSRTLYVRSISEQYRRSTDTHNVKKNSQSFLSVSNNNDHDY